MLTPDLIRTLLPALLGLPLVAALVLRFVGGKAARTTALYFSLGHLLLTFVIVGGGIFDIQSDPQLLADINRGKKQDERIFAPQFVQLRDRLGRPAVRGR